TIEDSKVSLHHCRMSANVATGGGAKGSALAAFAGATPGVDLLVVNNLVVQSDAIDASGPDANLCAIWLATEAQDMTLASKLVNNTIAGNSDRAISTSEFASGPSTSTLTLDVQNCILWSNGTQLQPSIKPDAGAGDVTPAVTYTDSEQSFTGVGNFTANPYFVGGTDFHLLGGSPCLQAGLDSYYTDASSTDPSILNLDLDAEERFLGPIDMGAYEMP
ncbi:MAG: hypothetical protein L0Z55_10155, partial [Planctomycetes bacterium]|nr:hypothetical protein [Planctomycetota bacterium]